MLSRVGLVVGALLVIAAAFGAGAVWGDDAWPGESIGLNSQQRTGDAVAIAQTAVAEKEDDVDQSRADLNAPTPTDTYVPDPDIRRGERQVVELMELSCQQNGTNCEFARLSRRQYREKYGS